MFFGKVLSIHYNKKKMARRYNSPGSGRNIGKLILFFGALLILGFMFKSTTSLLLSRAM